MPYHTGSSYTAVRYCGRPWRSPHPGQRLERSPSHRLESRAFGIVEQQEVGRDLQTCKRPGWRNWPPALCRQGAAATHWPICAHLLMSPPLRCAAAVVGLHDGMNVLKPALMADSLERQLPAPPISRSDAEFLESLGVEFVWGAEGVDVHELNNLFEKVGAAAGCG